MLVHLLRAPLASAAVLVAAVSLMTVACAGPTATTDPELPPPPASEAGDVVDTVHGVDVADPYRWLEERESEETQAWIDAQNTYTDQLLDDLPGRGALEARFTELMEVDQVRFPTVVAGRYFLYKRSRDQELWVLYLREGHDGEDQVLLDPHTLSDDNTLSISLQDVVSDGTMIAYGVREGGEDELTINLFDVDRKQDLDQLPKGRYSGIAIAPDKQTVYYSRVTETGPRVFLHTVGDDAANDRLIFGEGYDPGIILGTGLSEDERHLMVHVLYGASADRVDVFLHELGSEGGFRSVAEGLEGAVFADVIDGRVIAQTTVEAERGRVVEIDPADPEPGSWRTIVPQHETAVLRSLSGVGKRLFVSYLQDVQSRVVSYDLEGTTLGEIAFDTLGTVGNLGGRWDSNEAFFQFTSFNEPTTIYRYDVSSGERSVWSRPEIPIASADFVVEQVWYPSKDGTKVPMFLMYKKGIEKDGARPTYLTGYGGFNASLTPSFRSSAVVWAEQGGVYAVANLRGGGEFGEAWHEAGMLGNKQNVFDDFIAAGEWLIEAGYTRSDKLAISGGSNGGLLVSTVANQRPDLFGAVVCSYPLLDMVRYHQFLVARYWVPEYGSSEDPEQFPYLHAYSPYHNILEGARYPGTLFVTGDADTRVDPLHARKMAARLQAVAGQPGPVLLRHHTKAGHSGGTPVSVQIENSVESFAFLLWQLGESA